MCCLPRAVSAGDGHVGGVDDDALGRVVQVTNPLGGITLTTYDPAGNVATTTVESGSSSAPNIVTTYSYDADNRVDKTVVGSGSGAATTLQYYDPNGNVFCSVSANAYAQGSSAYQCPNWQTSWIAAPPKPTSLYSTSPTSSQANNVTTAFYDADGDELQTTNPDLGTSISAYDADGRTYCTSDAVNVAAWLTAHSSSTYPYLCPTSPPTTPPTGSPGYTATIYDAAGLTTSVTDALANTTTYGYDSAGLQSSVTDPDSSATDYCYYYQSGSGQCAASAPSGGGSGDDLYKQTLENGKTTTYTYYADDERDTTNTAAGTTTDTYDDLGDLTAETYSSTASGYSTPSNLSYTYYVDGSRETMTDATGTTTYTPDANGDVTQQAFSAGSGTGLSSKTIGYSYFTTGALASVEYPSYTGHSSPSVSYTYDALGNMASETDWLGYEVTFADDGDGNLTAQDNNVSSGHTSGTSSTAFSYDNADLNTAATSTLTECGGSETLTQSFSGSSGSRNADGQVSEDSEAYTGSCSGMPSYERNYSYDLDGRVVYQGSVAQGSSADNFTYDAAGFPTEISSHDSAGNFDTYTQVANSTEGVTSQTPVSGSGGSTTDYTYDTLGDLATAVVGSATTTYSYNQLGEMTTDAAGLTSSYQYTGDGLEAATTYDVPSWASATSVDGTNSLNAVSCRVVVVLRRRRLRRQRCHVQRQHLVERDQHRRDQGAGRHLLSDRLVLRRGRRRRQRRHLQRLQLVVGDKHRRNQGA